MDIDKILEITQRKYLKGMHLPITVKEIQAGYLISHISKISVYVWLRIKLPCKKSAIHKVEAPVEKFILLAIPEICAHKIITIYHSSLFAGHQGVIKTYLTIGDRFFIPGLMHNLHAFIKGCHICHLAGKDKPPTRQLQTRIYLNYRTLLRLSMDLKVMAKSHNVH